MHLHYPGVMHFTQRGNEGGGPPELVKRKKMIEVNLMAVELVFGH